jgi:hypothetical protein
MHTIVAISEPEMVAIFLQAEIQSSRVQQRILSVLQRDGQDRRIVDHPNLSDSHENSYRAHVLGESRGCDSELIIFEGAHRMTAHFLVPKAQRRQINAIVGFSSYLLDWAFY